MVMKRRRRRRRRVSCVFSLSLSFLSSNLYSFDVLSSPNPHLMSKFSFLQKWRWARGKVWMVGPRRVVEFFLLFFRFLFSLARRRTHRFSLFRPSLSLFAHQPWIPAAAALPLRARRPPSARPWLQQRTEARLNREAPAPLRRREEHHHRRRARRNRKGSPNRRSSSALRSRSSPAGPRSSRPGVSSSTS